MKKLSLLALTTALLTGTSLTSTAQDLDAFKAQVLEDVGKIASNSLITSKIKERNTAHASLTEADILKLDSAWREEVKTGTYNVVDTLLNNEASKELVKMKDESKGVYGEIFIMDDKGLNVASSDVTSDYWQGDEAKWKETYLKGAGSTHISEVEFDESVQAFTAQISSAISDETGAVIGAVTFSVIME